VRVRLLGIAAVVAALSGVAARAEARGAAPWTIGPEPAWIAPPPAEVVGHAPIDKSVTEYLLDDDQVRVSPAGVSRFRHIRLRPRSPGQVEEVSQIELELDPAYQRLTIHHAHVVRGGRPVSKLRPSDVRVAQRERDLEERIFDGALTAVILLPDVRVGDVIDYSFTLDGSDPLLGGKFVGRFSLADDTFSAAWRERILLPAGRSLAIKNHGVELAPKVTDAGQWREYLWEQRDVAPVESEDELPDWFDAQPWVDVSEFRSWGEVAALYARLFPAREAPGPLMSSELARLRALDSDQGRLLEATRFVQDEIRYTGIENGLGSHKPFSPSTVLERRFGDCKDKAALLVALLGELGVTARPALVDTTRGRGLDAVLPSPYAFDHAIVQVAFGGATTFIDPTASYQRGPLAERQPPPYQRALVVAPDTSALVPIPRPLLREPSTAVRETFTVAPDGASAELEVETTLRHDEADDMRRRLSSHTRKELGRDYLNFYAENDPTVSLARDLEATDDERRNVVVLREHYHLGAFWQDSKRELLSTALSGHLESPRIKQRQMPFALEFPFHASHTTVVRLQVPPVLDSETVDLGDDHVSFAYSARVDAGALVLTYDLRTLTDAVAPEKAQRFFALLDRIRGRAGYVLRRKLPASGRDAWLEAHAGMLGAGVGGGFFVGFLAVGGRAFLRARRGRAFRKRRAFASGEAAATAIEVASDAGIAGAVAALRCSCGGRYHPASDRDRQQVSYDGRTLSVLAARCRACGHERRVFVSVRGA
jgi:transglutaminase-like putative cysteine protease